MTVPEVAEALGVSRSRVKQYASSGLLRTVAPSGQKGSTPATAPIVFHRTEVTAVLNEEYISAIGAAKRLSIGTRTLIKEAAAEKILVRYLGDGSGRRSIHVPISYVECPDRPRQVDRP